MGRASQVWKPSKCVGTQPRAGRLFCSQRACVQPPLVAPPPAPALVSFQALWWEGARVKRKVRAAEKETMNWWHTRLALVLHEQPRPRGERCQTAPSPPSVAAAAASESPARSCAAPVLAPCVSVCPRQNDRWQVWRTAPSTASAAPAAGQQTGRARGPRCDAAQQPARVARLKARGSPGSVTGHGPATSSAHGDGHCMAARADHCGHRESRASDAATVEWHCQWSALLVLRRSCT